MQYHLENLLRTHLKMREEFAGSEKLGLALKDL